MHVLRDLPLKRKLTVISLLTSGAALVLTCAVFIAYEQISYRRDMTRELGIAAHIIGSNIASSLSFDDNDSAAIILHSLSEQPPVIRGGVYDKSGAIFATYRRASEQEKPWPPSRSETHYFDHDSLHLFLPIPLAGETIGTIYLQSDIGELHKRLWLYLGIAGTVLLAAMLVSWLIASRLQRLITEPLSQLAAIAGRVGAEKAYSMRAIKRGDDEVGRLVDGFNSMLAQVETRDAELHAAHKHLEHRVEERTRELRASEESIRLIVDTAFDAIVTIDLAGRITAWNLQAEKTFGWSHAEALGRDFIETLVSEPQRETNRQFLRRFIEAEGQGPINTLFEFNATHRSGRELPIEVAVSTVRLDGGAVLISAFLRDITESKHAEAELERVHRQLLQTSHQAGMAEVATGVLHNVGNVLNSVNVSATLIADLVRRSKSPNVAKIRDLLEQHRAELGPYLTEDAKGRLIPAYLTTLAESLSTEQKTVITELDSLHKNIGHIKDIVAMQQSYAKTSGVVETISVPDLIEDSVRMNAGSLARHEVGLARRYDGRPVIIVEKNKVLQILVNLIRNAKYACNESGRTDKLITIRTTVDDQGVDIAVIDNGVGIAPENLTRIFAHGFTTRKHGHGFGLHSGALAAKELGGALSVHSEGLGRGATFTLRLPFRPLADSP
ncbi:MAG: PAS domain S-box protein [Burkholderiales bacterium]|nr:PAS domain S-box protein [Opitutaceae bacterium]